MEILKFKEFKQMFEKKETDPSLKPPKKWWKKMTKEVKKGNPSYDEETVSKTVGKIWSELSNSKKSEIRGREGKTYGKANEEKITPEEFNELPARVYKSKKPGKGRPSIDKEATKKAFDEYKKKKKK